MENENKIPGTDITKPSVKLTGYDGNAFAILGRVSTALRSSGASAEVQKQFMDKATAGDYDNLLRTCTEYVDVK